MIVEELNGLYGNAYSASRYLYFSIKKTNENIIASSFDKDTLNEGVTFELPKDELGGVIVLSTDVNAVQVSSNKLVNWVKSKWETLKNRLGKDKKINDIAQKHNLVGWTVGKFLRGRYTAKNGKVFDENSLSIEIVGIPDDKLIEVAEDLCNAFKQESVLVKTYGTNRIMFVDGEKTPKQESVFKQLDNLE